MISVRFAYAQKSPLNEHADVSNMVRVLNFALRLHLHPYFMCASSEGSVETAQLRRLSRAFIA